MLRSINSETGQMKVLDRVSEMESHWMNQMEQKTKSRVRWLKSLHKKKQVNEKETIRPSESDKKSRQTTHRDYFNAR